MFVHGGMYIIALEDDAFHKMSIKYRGVPKRDKILVAVIKGY